jgi:DinB superfamily
MKNELMVMNRDRDELRKELEHTYNELKAALCGFTDEGLNIIPFKGSWSAGQVAEHIIKATSGIPDQHTQFAGRVYNATDESIRSLFLNFSIKMKTPEFLEPESGTYSVGDLLSKIDNIRRTHMETVDQKDLHALCLDFELPMFGKLTRYEWIKFICYHTQRHTQQIRNIHHGMFANEESRK